jgi:Tfp pilus assembly protein PilF
LVSLLAFTLCASCASTPANDTSAPALDTRDTARAERLTQQAQSLSASDPKNAERLLRDAIEADRFFGPARNNLGALLLRATPPQLYEAATQLEWACKLMPGHPDPRVNLALVMELAGRTDEAVAHYRAALETYPQYLPAIEGLTSLQLRTGTSDEHTGKQLAEIALRGSSPEVQAWARKQMTLRQR